MHCAVSVLYRLDGDKVRDIYLKLDSDFKQVGQFTLANRIYNSKSSTMVCS